MLFSRSADYAIRAVVHLAKQPDGGRVPLQQIAGIERIPPALLSKILQKLVKGGIVRSYRGLHGGYALSTDPTGITLKAIVEEIDGPMIVFECLDHPDCCEFTGDCNLQGIFLRAQQRVLEVMADATVSDVIPCAQREPTPSP